MSEHVGYVVKVEHLRPHSNADRLQVATFFGNDTCVSLDVKVGDIGVYFPTDLQLSEEFCAVNNLVRKKDENGNNIGGYMDPDKRNVTTIKLRGEKSDGLYLPISCLDYTGTQITEFIPGVHIEVVNGHEICRKYIPRTNPKGQRIAKEGNRVRKHHAPVAPLFVEHADTEQLAYNVDAFKIGDHVEITLKMHGTSQRTGYLPVFQKYKRTLWDRIMRREGTPVYDWGYVTGTRRTVLETYEGGFYGSNEFRAPHAKFFEGKLRKGEEVYYEVVGFQTSGAPIMGAAQNKKTGDKEFVKQYGDTTVFSYGCAPDGKKMYHGNDNDGAFTIPVEVPQSDFYVYRMTMTNEDGDMVEYTPDFMRYRCEQMGCKTVPVFWEGFLENNPQEEIMQLAEKFYDGPDPVGKTHVREGVVCRIVNRPKFTAYKHKNFYFKALEGIVKAEADAPDIEEAEELNDSESGN